MSFSKKQNEKDRVLYTTNAPRERALTGHLLILATQPVVLVGHVSKSLTAFNSLGGEVCRQYDNLSLF